jgi:hippurate hydrolase
MDALPVVEHSGVSFASEHAGRMHACGHDGHMALALGLANWLALHPDRMSRSVLLVFEPAEETTGGARCVIESGVLARCGVDRIFGFHLWPDLPKGSIASRPGALLAASNEVNIEIAGRASHIAKAELGADALEAAARVLLASYDYVRKLQKTETCLLKFGRMQAGRVRNQIAAVSRLEGSLRSFSETVRDRSEDELRCIASQQAEVLGCSAQTDFSEGYPPVINDAALFGLATEALPELSELARPLLISDDFAWYQRKTPGVFLLLGTGTGIPLHSDEFRFDESVLSAGLSAYQRLVCLP